MILGYLLSSGQIYLARSSSDTTLVGGFGIMMVVIVFLYATREFIFLIGVSS